MFSDSLLWKIHKYDTHLGTQSEKLFQSLKDFSLDIISRILFEANFEKMDKNSNFP